MKIIVDGKPLKLKYRPFNSGGKGGQHSNKTLNAIEITTTLPDGRKLSATSQTSKSQHRNKKLAEGVMATRVKEAFKPIHIRQDISERIRTYNEPDNRVTDHLSGEKRAYKDVMSGGKAFGELLEARRKAVEEKRAMEEDI